MANGIFDRTSNKSEIEERIKNSYTRCKHESEAFAAYHQLSQKQIQDENIIEVARAKLSFN